MLYSVQAPFDRHDWFIDRCGKEVRYVIDYYEGHPEADGSPTMHADVRPALDSMESVMDRAKMSWHALRNKWRL